MITKLVATHDTVSAYMKKHVSQSPRQWNDSVRLGDGCTYGAMWAHLDVRFQNPFTAWQLIDRCMIRAFLEESQDYADLED